MTLGPTGKITDGGSTGDRGGLNATISITATGKIRLDFFTSLSWLDMSKDEAAAFACALSAIVNELTACRTKFSHNETQVIE